MNQRAPTPKFCRRRLLRSGAAALISTSLSTFSLSGLSPPHRRAWAATNDGTLPPSLSALLADFRNCPGLSADFEEDKRILLLAAPLKSNGRIYFHPLHAVARVTEKPNKSHLVVSGKKIIVKEGNTRREVDLSDKPALRELIGSLLHLLSGNEQKLISNYETFFKQEENGAWSLRLSPKNESVKKLVESFSFTGSGIKLRQLRVKETNGDESITRFSAVDTKRKFTAAEIAQIFEI